jgi:hypothetical protein
MHQRYHLQLVESAHGSSGQYPFLPEVEYPSRDPKLSKLCRCRQGIYNIRIAADSTMFLMVNLFIALSLGVHREQFEQRI